MSEKKIIVDGLRFNYNGPFDIVEFYKEIDKWLQENGMEKEVKKKVEHVEKDGKKIEWMVECWKMAFHHIKAVVRVRALFTKVTEVEVVKGKEKRKLNQGNVLVTFDGFLESHLHHHWTTKPWFFFMRGLFDKLVWPVWIERFDKQVSKPTYDLHKRLESFFNLYKY